jgi:hypothetical protein
MHITTGQKTLKTISTARGIVADMPVIPTTQKSQEEGSNPRPAQAKIRDPI